MSPRVCEKCGKHLISQRADAKFCSRDCRNSAGNARRRKAATDKRLTPASGAGNEPSGQIRDLSEARNRRAAKEPTDLERCRIALKAVGPKGLHSHDMRRRGLTGNPSARIIELEELGYAIKHEREHKGRRPGTRYTLLAEPSTEAKAA